MKQTVSMHGPSFDGSGRLVNREVTKGDIGAYRAAGYVEGSIVEEIPADEIHDDGTPKVTHTEADALEQAEVKPKGKRK